MLAADEEWCEIQHASASRFLVGCPAINPGLPAIRKTLHQPRLPPTSGVAYSLFSLLVVDHMVSTTSTPPNWLLISTLPRQLVAETSHFHSVLAPRPSHPLHGQRESVRIAHSFAVPRGRRASKNEAEAEPSIVVKPHLPGTMRIVRYCPLTTARYGGTPHLAARRGRDIGLLTCILYLVR